MHAYLSPQWLTGWYVHVHAQQEGLITGSSFKRMMWEDVGPEDCDMLRMPFTNQLNVVGLRPGSLICVEVRWRLRVVMKWMHAGLNAA